MLGKNSDHRKVPLTREFKRLMWSNMADDREWADAMDELIDKLPPGKSWPEEKGNPWKG